MKSIIDCSEENRFSILKILERGGLLTNKQIKQITRPKTKGIFNYHLRQLKRLGVISLTEDRQYYITRTGSFVVKTIESLGEEFITDNKNEVCINTKNNEHEFISICGKCGYVKT